MSSGRHHGSLSREMREDTEAALKAGNRPATAVCTTTLELGIDIGSVKSVAQIGPPAVRAALRQRLGRSGRRPGEPAILRSYVVESAVAVESPISDRLRESLVQSAACIRLLLGKLVRAAARRRVALIDSRPADIVDDRGTRWCHGRRVVAHVSHTRSLCRTPAHRLGHTAARTWAPGDVGAGFLRRTAAWHCGRTCRRPLRFLCGLCLARGVADRTGRPRARDVAIDSPVFEGLCIIFGGRRWKILSVCTEPAVLTVAPDPTGRPPQI